jgi:PKD repeat protein
VGRPGRALFGALLLLLAFATRADAASVTASFEFTPATPLSDEVVTFTSTSTAGVDSTITSQEWNLDGRPASGPTATRWFSHPGLRTVTLTVTATDASNGSATDTATAVVSVQNRPPTASFSFSPAAPATGQAVVFKSTAKDPDGSIATVEWDFTGDNIFEATGKEVTTSFKTPGVQTVQHRVTADRGASAVTSRAIAIGGRPPVAAFTFTPPSPNPGDRVTFFSTASDPDNQIVEQAWDLDNDGSFNDGFGPTAARNFPAAGPYTVRLRVTDEGGLSTIGSVTLAVGSFPQAALFSRGMPLLNPFPIVRLVGTIGRRGARLRRLLVTMPSGASMTVRCNGRGCPFRRTTRAASLPPELQLAPVARTAALVRVKRLERRLLRVGTTIRIYITKPNEIGKYTRFKIRRGRAPSRIDRCLVPGAPAPLRCST